MFKGTLKIQKMIKRRPKQNFNINYSEILDSSLNKSQKSILIAILKFHKANCKFEYMNFLNADLCISADISEVTMLKHKKLLERDNLFKTNKVRCGKSYVLQYRFNWTKLLKLQFITPIEKNEYSPIFKKKSKPNFKNGDTILYDKINKIKDEVFYKVKEYHLHKDGIRKGNGVTKSMLGKSLKTAMKIQEKKKELQYTIA